MTESENHVKRYFRPACAKPVQKWHIPSKDAVNNFLKLSG